MSMLGKILISCKQASYLHEKKREGKLDTAEGLGLFIHLLYCRFCRQFVKQVELLERSSRKLFQSAEQRFHLSSIRKAELQKAFNEELKK